MSAKDLYHQIVKNALLKDNWTITHDPLTIRFNELNFHIDLGAEQVIAAERKGEKIAIEIKSFVRPSIISEFHSALGQFLNYRWILGQEEPERLLLMAVPVDVYEKFFREVFGQAAIERFDLKLVVYDVQTEEIVQWVK